MKGIWPWVILGAVAICGYLFVYKPLSTPGGRQILGGAIAGDTKAVGRGIVSIYESNPEMKKQVLNTPEKVRKYNELKQKYGANYARAVVYG